MGFIRPTWGLCMPHYFFHFRQGRTQVTDDEGLNLPSPAAAERHARQVAFELGRNKPLSALQGCEIVVEASGGAEIAGVALSDINGIASGI